MIRAGRGGGALLLVVGVSAFAQDDPLPLAERGVRQLDFLETYRKVKPAPEVPGSPSSDAIARLDVWLKELERRWRVETMDDPVAYRRFEASVWDRTLSSITDGMPPEWAECRVWSNYMVPSFLADFTEIGIEPEPQRAWLFRDDAFDAVFGDRSVRCDLPATQWQGYFEAFQMLPLRARRYVSAGAYPDEDVKGTLEKVAEKFSSRRPLFGILNAVRAGEADLAFPELAAAFVREEPMPMLIPLARRLADSYAGMGRPDKALAVLDLLARSTTAGELSRETLRSWYATADPDRGLARYETLLPGPRPVLSPNDELYVLDGSRLDLATDRDFDLTTLQGRLVLIAFWTSWSEPCIAEISELRAFEAELGEEVALIAVTSDVFFDVAEEKASDFVRQHDIDYLALYDKRIESLTTLFGVSGWPVKFFLDEEGRLLTHPTDETRRSVTLAEVRAYLARRAGPPAGVEQAEAPAEPLL